MAETKLMPSFYLLSCCCLFSLMFCVVVETKRLSIKLIHRVSSESPLYPGYLSTGERTRRLVQQSMAYAHHLIKSDRRSKGSELSIIQQMIRPRTGIENFHLLVEVGIGTFKTNATPSYVPYFLLLDTGSSLTWTQCEGCKKFAHRTCFPQRQPVFPSSQSLTYRPIPCGKDLLCYKGECINNTCSYHKMYIDGSSTLGFLAYETFTFPTNNNGTEKIKNLLFGCGIDNKGSQFRTLPRNRIAGIMGMGMEDRSFVSQISSLGQGQFSYCLPPLKRVSSGMFLRFGADIPKRQGLHATSLLPNLGTRLFNRYYLSLVGISIAKQRLTIPPETFRQRKNGGGGCIIDSGTTFSYIARKAYDVLVKNMANHLSGLKLKRFPRRDGLELCYEKLDVGGLRNLPSVTFHMRDPDLVVPPEGVFSSGKTSSRQQYICLSMLPFDGSNLTIIGAKQQVNNRFIFDIKQHKMYFRSEDRTRGMGPVSCMFNP